MEKRVETVKVIVIIALVLVCLSAIVAVTVRFGRFEQSSSNNSRTEDSSNSVDNNKNDDNKPTTSVTLNKTTYMFLDNVSEGASAGDNDSFSVVNITSTVKTTSGIRDVDYSYSWNDAQSEWATGKDVTDYISVNYDDDNPLTIKLVCQKPFGEKIVLVATSRADKSVFSQCTIDYGAKVNNVHMVVNGDTEYGVFSLNSNNKFLYKYTPNAYNYFKSVTFDYGVGTVRPTVANLVSDVLPQYSVSNLLTSEFMLKTTETATLQYIEKYCKGMQRRTVCVKTDDSYKYIDFSSPYMFLIGITGQEPPETAIVKEFADHINSQNWAVDCVTLYYTVYDSLRGSGNRYEVKRDLVYTPNSGYVFGEAVTA